MVEVGYATARGIPRESTIMEICFQKLSNVLIDLEAVNEERTVENSKQLDDLRTFKMLVVDQKRHLKLDKIKNCIVIPGRYASKEMNTPNPMRYMEVRRTDVNDDIYECLYEATKFYSSRKKDHASLVEKCNGDYYVPLEEIELYIESLEEFINEEMDKIASFAPTVCMLRGCKKGIAYRFPSHLPGEEGKEKVMCLECQFTFFDKNIVDILSKEDLCVNDTANGKEEDVKQGEGALKKRKVDTVL